MRKRVGLARALMLEPEILMYDEPTSGLDPLSSRLVDDLIAETRDRFGVTSIVISHDMAGALRIADHIYVLSQGRLVADGTPEELVRGSSELVHQFFQASGISAEHALGENSPSSIRYQPKRDAPGPIPAGSVAGNQAACRGPPPRQHAPARRVA